MVGGLTACTLPLAPPSPESTIRVVAPVAKIETQKTPAQVVQDFSKAANEGVGYALVQMGHFYRDGYRVERDIHKALDYYERAARQGELTGLLALGDVYRKGWYGLKRDPDKALRYYQRAAALGSFEAEYRIAWLLVNQSSSHPHQVPAFNLLQELAAEGHPQALCDLGDLYLEGRLVEKDLNKARDYYVSAAQAGAVEAAFKLGLFYQTEESMPDYSLSFAWFLKAAEGDFAPAQLQVGHLYRDGRGGPKNYEQAAYWYSKAAAQGSSNAALELADLYHAGKGVGRSFVEAARLYESAAQQDNAYAQLMLSVLYQQGRGVCADMQKSVHYYEAAMRHSGSAMAQYRIAKRYADGFGLPKDFKEAIRWYQLAAEQGLAIAAVELGDLYVAGRGGEEDADLQAFDWYYRAAKKGNAYAQYRSGLMLLEGRGVAVNPALAALWIRKAAHLGAKQAQHQLGLMYLNGIGVRQNDIYAYAWLSLGLEGQQVGAQLLDVLQTLTDRMMPSDRKEAVALSQELGFKYRSM